MIEGYLALSTGTHMMVIIGSGLLAFGLFEYMSAANRSVPYSDRTQRTVDLIGFYAVGAAMAWFANVLLICNLHG